MAIALTLVLMGAQAAVAAEIVGNPCVADGTEPDATILRFSIPTSEPFIGGRRSRP